MKNARKAEMDFKKLAGMIIVVACLLTLILFMANVLWTTSSIVEDSECKNSIMQHVAASKASAGDLSTEIKCPTQYYTSKANSADKVKAELAESLKTCWGTWGKGELSLFNRDTTFCNICSVTEFKNKNIKFNDFLEYLSTEYATDSQTYAQYLKMYSTDTPASEYKERLSQPDVQKVEIDTSKKYASVFVYAKGSTAIKEFFESITPSNPVTGAAVGGAGGAIIGGFTAYGLGSVAVAAGVLSGPPGWVTLASWGAGGAFVGIGLGAIFPYFKDHYVDYIAMPILIEYDAAQLQRLGCSEAPSSQDTQKEDLG